MEVNFTDHPQNPYFITHEAQNPFLIDNRNFFCNLHPRMRQEPVI